MKQKKTAYKGRANEAKKQAEREINDAKKFKQWLINWRKRNPYKPNNLKEYNAKFQKDKKAHLNKAKYSAQFKKLMKSW